MTSLPEGCPPIPNVVEVDNLVAIVAIHDADAASANQNSNFPRTALPLACHIFLSQIEGRPPFIFGRLSGTDHAPHSIDVFLPGSRIAKKQFSLIPDDDTNCWRVQSHSETLMQVNGVPLQDWTSRTKKKQDKFPTTLFLDQSRTNRVLVCDLDISIWLPKPAREVTRPDLAVAVSNAHLQQVNTRREDWAQVRYILRTDAEQVSTRSYRVLERFTGSQATAKLFDEGERIRDKEFLAFAKEKFDDSIVRYVQSTAIEGIPSIITSTHEGFASFAAIHGDMVGFHPGIRFEIATKLLRRLFSALEYLHYNNIIHGDVSDDSVLLRMLDNRLDEVLLVDYTNTWTIGPGDELPKEAMIEDGRTVMELVETACDIWSLRKGPHKDARNEEEMRMETETAHKEFQKVHRVASKLSEEEIQTEKGKKMLKLARKKQGLHIRLREEQEHNTNRREIRPVTTARLNDHLIRLAPAFATQGVGEKIYTVLSLGHEWLDKLANPLYSNQWRLTPREVCAKLWDWEGHTKDPWRTLTVTKGQSFGLEVADLGVGPERCVDEDSFTEYLVRCYELYPEWRATIELEYDRHIRPVTKMCSHQQIVALRDALVAQGRLPQYMDDTLRQLAQLDASQFPRTLNTRETHHVWYHVPSRMFNISQLQLHAGVDVLQACVNDGSVRCDNFAEVRGEPKLQGCYVPLALFKDFVQALQISNVGVPTLDGEPLMVDPADFSREPHAGRIVLARIGLVSYATVIRTADQFYHTGNPNLFESADPFLPTYFGDMKVLPERIDGRFEYPRPSHWSKFKTADEIEKSREPHAKKIMVPKSRLISQFGSGFPSKQAVVNEPEFPDVSKSHLRQWIERNEHMRNETNPPPPKRILAPKTTNQRINKLKRYIAPSIPVLLADPAERAALRGHQKATSFEKKNANLLSEPPRIVIDENYSFMEVGSSFGQNNDQADVEQWVNELSDSSDEDRVKGFMNFKIHDKHLLKTGQLTAGKGNSTPNAALPGSFDSTSTVPDDTIHGLLLGQVGFNPDMNVSQDSKSDEAQDPKSNVTQNPKSTMARDPKSKELAYGPNRLNPDPRPGMSPWAVLRPPKKPVAALARNPLVPSRSISGVLPSAYTNPNSVLFGMKPLDSTEPPTKGSGSPAPPVAGSGSQPKVEEKLTPYTNPNSLLFGLGPPAPPGKRFGPPQPAKGGPSSRMANPQPKVGEKRLDPFTNPNSVLFGLKPLDSAPPSAQPQVQGLVGPVPNVDLPELSPTEDGDDDDDRASQRTLKPGAKVPDPSSQPAQPTVEPVAHPNPPFNMNLGELSPTEEDEDKDRASQHTLKPGGSKPVDSSSQPAQSATQDVTRSSPPPFGMNPSALSPTDIADDDPASLRKALGLNIPALSPTKVAEDDKEGDDDLLPTEVADDYNAANQHEVPVEGSTNVADSPHSSFARAGPSVAPDDSEPMENVRPLVVPDSEPESWSFVRKLGDESGGDLPPSVFGRRD